MNAKHSILILGGKGQVGQSLTQSFWGLEFNIVSLSRQEADITCNAQIKSILMREKWAFVINMIAYRNVEKAEIEKDTCYKINVNGVENLARLTSILNTPLLHYSTDYVFDGIKKMPYLEEDCTNPLNFYGLTKADGESKIRSINSRHIILRISWIYGEKGDNFLQKLWFVCEKSREFSFSSDQKGTPTRISDITRTTILMIKKILEKPFPEYGTYHYSEREETTWYEIAELVTGFHEKWSRREDYKVFPIKTNEAEKKYGLVSKRPLNSVLNCSKNERFFGIKTIDWKTQMIKTLEEMIQ